MSGGAWEYVAGYVNNGNSSLTSYGSSLVNGTQKRRTCIVKQVQITIQITTMQIQEKIWRCGIRDERER